MSKIDLYYADVGDLDWAGSITQDGAGHLLKNENGRYMMTLTNRALACKEQALRTIGHELEHASQLDSEEFSSLAPGVANQAGDAAAEAAGKSLWESYQESLSSASSEDDEDIIEMILVTLDSL